MVELGRGLLVAVALVGILLDFRPIAFVAIAGSGLLSAVSSATVRSLVPSILERRQLPAGNAVLGLAQDGAMALGALAAGIALATTTVAVALSIDLVTFVVAAFLYMGVRVPSLASADRRGARRSRRRVQLHRRAPPHPRGRRRLRGGDDGDRPDERDAAAVPRNRARVGRRSVRLRLRGPRRRPRARERRHRTRAGRRDRRPVDRRGASPHGDGVRGARPDGARADRAAAPRPDRVPRRDDGRPLRHDHPARGGSRLLRPRVRPQLRVLHDVDDGSGGARSAREQTWCAARRHHRRGRLPARGGRVALIGTRRQSPPLQASPGRIALDTRP